MKTLIQTSNGTIHTVQRTYVGQSGQTVYVACKMVRGVVMNEGEVTCKLCKKGN